MNVFLTLVKRELGGYFMSLTGYIVITVMLLLLGITFVEVASKLNANPTDAPITEVFYMTYYFWLILLLTAPVITMRSFALEKFSGTYETLMTAPVRDLHVVLAKFTGALVFYLLAWLPLLGYTAALQYYANNSAGFDLAAIATTFFGILLIGSVYMSMGCFASALTRSQIIAAIISYGFGLTLFIMSLRSLVAGPGSGWKDKAFLQLSMVEHMIEFTRGIIDTRYLVYYLSVTAMFLFLTLKVVESRRWK